MTLTAVLWVPQDCCCSQAGTGGCRGLHRADLPFTVEQIGHFVVYPPSWESSRAAIAVVKAATGGITTLQHLT